LRLIADAAAETRIRDLILGVYADYENRQWCDPSGAPPGDSASSSRGSQPREDRAVFVPFGGHNRRQL